jgi:Fe-S oxidoreductase
VKRADYETCAYCPKLCRHVCPVAVGTARESTTPTAMMTGALLALDGIVTPAEGYASASLCTSCGACTEVCLLDQPVRDLLREARGAWGPRVSSSLGTVEGAGTWVAVECDERRWSEALAKKRGGAVARFRTSDHHGARLLDHPARFATHASALRDRLAGRTVIVSCHACERVAREAGLEHEHLSNLQAPERADWVHQPCHGPRLGGAIFPGATACCGAAEPFASVHPDAAAEVARWWERALAGASLATPDTRCGVALRKAGVALRDPVDALLASFA